MKTKTKVALAVAGIGLGSFILNGCGENKHDKFSSTLLDNVEQTVLLPEMKMPDSQVGERNMSFDRSSYKRLFEDFLFSYEIQGSEFSLIIGNIGKEDILKNSSKFKLKEYTQATFFSDEHRKIRFFFKGVNAFSSELFNFEVNEEYNTANFWNDYTGPIDNASLDGIIKWKENGLPDKFSVLTYDGISGTIRDNGYRLKSHEFLRDSKRNLVQLNEYDVTFSDISDYVDSAKINLEESISNFSVVAKKFYANASGDTLVTVKWDQDLFPTEENPILYYNNDYVRTNTLSYNKVLNEVLDYPEIVSSLNWKDMIDSVYYIPKKVLKNSSSGTVDFFVMDDNMRVSELSSNRLTLQDTSLNWNNKGKEKMNFSYDGTSSVPDEVVSEFYATTTSKSQNPETLVEVKFDWEYVPVEKDSKTTRPILTELNYNQKSNLDISGTKCFIDEERNYELLDFHVPNISPVLWENKEIVKKNSPYMDMKAVSRSFYFSTPDGFIVKVTGGDINTFFPENGVKPYVQDPSKFKSKVELIHKDGRVQRLYDLAGGNLP